MDQTDCLKELAPFLQLGARTELKELAIAHVLVFTGNDSGVKQFCESDDFLVLLIALLSDNDRDVRRDAAGSLVNISAHADGAKALMRLDVKAAKSPPLHNPPDDIVTTCLRSIFDCQSTVADLLCMVLSNVTRTPEHVAVAVDRITDEQIARMTVLIADPRFNKRGATLEHLSSVLANLSQNGRVRRCILDEDRCNVHRLLPFTDYERSVVVRRGVVATLRNCCFEADSIMWLMGESVDVIPRLLVSLADLEELSTEDREELPGELPFLLVDKTREKDPEIRCMLVEALNQLAVTAESRRVLRDNGVYVIMKWLHKSETNDKVLVACENLVDILIRTEEEIGVDNLKQVDVPNDLTEKFNKLDVDVALDS